MMGVSWSATFMKRTRRMALHLYLGFNAKGVSRGIVQLPFLWLVLSRGWCLARLLLPMLQPERVRHWGVPVRLLWFVVPRRGCIVPHQFLPLRTERVGWCVVQFQSLYFVGSGRCNKSKATLSLLNNRHFINWRDAREEIHLRKQHKSVSHAVSCGTSDRQKLDGGSKYGQNTRTRTTRCWLVMMTGCLSLCAKALLTWSVTALLMSHFHAKCVGRGLVQFHLFRHIRSGCCGFGLYQQIVQCERWQSTMIYVRYWMMVVLR